MMGDDNNHPDYLLIRSGFGRLSVQILTYLKIVLDELLSIFHISTVSPLLRTELLQR
jgi:hypothetical protein